MNQYLNQVVEEYRIEQEQLDNLSRDSNSEHTSDDKNINQESTQQIDNESEKKAIQKFIETQRELIDKFESNFKLDEDKKVDKQTDEQEEKLSAKELREKRLKALQLNNQ